MILVEPVKWIFLPFGMAQWPVCWLSCDPGRSFSSRSFWGHRIQRQGSSPGFQSSCSESVPGWPSVFFLPASRSSPRAGTRTCRSDPIAAQIFSGVYFPIEVLPGWLRPVSYLIPHTYVIAALRRVLMPAGGDAAWDVSRRGHHHSSSNQRIAVSIGALDIQSGDGIRPQNRGPWRILMGSEKAGAHF